MGTIATALNEIAQHLQNLLVESGYAVPYFRYRDIVHMVFLLSEDSILVSFNDAVPQLLKYKENDISGRAFKKLIAKQSVAAWHGIKLKIAKKKNFNTASPLLFITRRAFISLLLHSSNADPHQ